MGGFENLKRHTATVGKRLTDDEYAALDPAERIVYRIVEEATNRGDGILCGDVCEIFAEIVQISDGDLEAAADGIDERIAGGGYILEDLTAVQTVH